MVDEGPAKAGGDWPGLESLPPSPPTRWPPPRARFIPTAPPPSLPAIIVAAVAVAILLAALFQVVSQDDRSAAPAGGTTVTTIARSTTAPPPSIATTPTTAPPIPPDPALEEAVTDAAGFVSRRRGHDLARPLPVARLDDGEFGERLRSTFDRGALEAEGNWLALLGLIGPQEDFTTAYLDERVRRTAAFFDSSTKEVVVRGVPGTPVSDSLRATIVHELTHVLDDRLFPFDRPEVRNPMTEIAFGFGALAEGDAEQVAGEWARQRGRAAAAGSGSYADVLGAQLDAPYDYGEVLVGRARARGGEAEVDRSLGDPPVTSEQVLHPEKYEVREPAVLVDRPPAEGQGREGRPVGELMFRQMLTPAVGPQRAAGAAAGWGGDRSVIWVRPPEEGGLTCLRSHIVMDTRVDLDELDGALQAWVGATPAATVRRLEDRVELTVCAAVPPPAFPTPPVDPRLAGDRGRRR